MIGFPLIPGDALLINISHYNLAVASITVTAIVIDSSGRQSANIRVIPLITAPLQVVMPLTAGDLVSVTAKNNETDYIAEPRVNIGLRRDSLGANPYVLQLIDCQLAGTCAASWHFSSGLSLGLQASVWQGINMLPPAAGADILSTLALPGVWRIIQVKFELTTDINVANRNVTFAFTGPDGENWLVPLTYLQTASLTYLYTYYSECKVPRQVANRIIGDLPYIQGTGSIRVMTQTAALQATDQFGEIYVGWRAVGQPQG